MKDIKSEWDELIISKLKSDINFDDLNINYGSNIIMAPNVVDFDAHNSNLSVNSKPWINMSSIKGSNSEELNKLIHLALNQGANGLDLFIDSNLDINQALKGVLTEYLDVRIRCTDNIDILTIKQNFNESKFPNVRWIHKNSDVVQVDIVNSRIDSIKSFFNYFDSSVTYDIIITVGKNILFEISLLRAIRQVLISKHISTFNIIARYDIEGDNQLGDYNLIELSYKVMSAIMGNTDVVLTKYLGDEQSRLALNIHNVLELESSFKSVMNPVQGSYYIEELTKKIIEQIQ